MTAYSDTTELRKSRRPLVQNPLSVLLQNVGTGDFPEPLRLIGVRVDKLKDLIWEMAANWESLHPQESACGPSVSRSIQWGVERA